MPSANLENTYAQRYAEVPQPWQQNQEMQQYANRKVHGLFHTADGRPIN